ncbi:hypothetical protein GGD88_000019 [Roseospira goensis]|uniref:Uncharacterized protein n=1 Tax=Roseospira goensis TaxID=391922 RepID=A0A7W6RW24_9PROT|nr:hypothetical protein [Roseospira goensis]
MMEDLPHLANALALLWLAAFAAMLLASVGLALVAA